jgi:hypothetical protein
MPRRKRASARFAIWVEAVAWIRECLNEGKHEGDESDEGE